MTRNQQAGATRLRAGRIDLVPTQLLRAVALLRWSGSITTQRHGGVGQRGDLSGGPLHHNTLADAVERLTAEEGEPIRKRPAHRRVARGFVAPSTGHCALAASDRPPTARSAGAGRRKKSGRKVTQDKEDAAADTATAVILSFARARGADTFASFVYGQYLDVWRRILTDVKRHHVPIDEAIENRPAGSDPCGYPPPDQRAALRTCLLHLLARERRAVELRYLEEASSERIARDLGVTPENARRLVCTGLARLRRAMPGALALVRGKPA